MPVTGTKFNKFIEFLGKGTIDLDTNVFKAALVKSTYVFDAAHEDFATSVQAHEVAAGNGYTAGGVTLSGVTWAYNSGTGKTVFDCNDPSWTATGGDLGPATGLVVYDSTSGKLVGFIDFGGAQTAGNSTEFKVAINGAGLVRFS